MALLGLVGRAWRSLNHKLLPCELANRLVETARYCAVMQPVVVDTRGRPVRDLRISVTDRCNFRCGYCMPAEIFNREYEFLSRDLLLSFEEITRVARAFAQLGTSKIRLTGGEPLLRKGIEDLVALLAEIGDLELTLTTNGSLLARKAEALAKAGLRSEEHTSELQSH